MHDPLLFLDTILNCLTAEKKKLYTSIELLSKVKQKLKVDTEDREATSNLYSMFQRALPYLIEEGYVFSKESGDKINYSITFKGYVKIKTKSFSESRYLEIKSARHAKVTRWLDWIQKTVTPLIAMAALVLSLVNSCSKEKVSNQIEISTDKNKG